MNDMDDVAMQQALEHDAAIKGANGGTKGVADAGQDTETVQSPVPAEALLDGLELKNAALAKSVAMSYTNVAQQCAGLILGELQPVVDLNVVDQPAPKRDVESIKVLLEVAARALALAHEADVLGDKAAVRMMETADSAPAE